MVSDSTNSYSVVRMSTLELKDNYKLNEVYKVKWDQQKLNACLIFIGNLNIWALLEIVQFI